tara:strand:+ start:460 stop:765 length:306 start_codon:yes stop_codon:yes gene_type:complete
MTQNRTGGTLAKVLETKDLPEEARKLVQYALSTEQQNSNDLVTEAIVKDTVLSKTVDLFKATTDISAVLVLAICHAGVVLWHFPTLQPFALQAIAFIPIHG